MTIDYEHLWRASRSYAELHLKIGVYEGRFLCELAHRHPDHYYIGIEVQKEPHSIAAVRVQVEGLANAAVIHAEAHEFIHAWQYDGAVTTIHIYHPTPDPQTIGLPYRLLRSDFIRECRRVLQVWGTIRIVTDVHEYFRSAMHAFSPDEWWAVDWEYDEIARRKGCFVASPTELHYRHVEHAPIYAAQFRRVK